MENCAVFSSFDFHIKLNCCVDAMYTQNCSNIRKARSMQKQLSASIGRNPPDSIFPVHKHTDNLVSAKIQRPGMKQCDVMRITAVLLYWLNVLTKELCLVIMRLRKTYERNTRTLAAQRFCLFLQQSSAPYGMFIACSILSLIRMHHTIASVVELMNGSEWISQEQTLTFANTHTQHTGNNDVSKMITKELKRCFPVLILLISKDLLNGFQPPDVLQSSDKCDAIVTHLCLCA